MEGWILKYVKRLTFTSNPWKGLSISGLSLLLRCSTAEFTKLILSRQTFNSNLYLPSPKKLSHEATKRDCLFYRYWPLWKQQTPFGSPNLEIITSLDSILLQVS